MTTNYCENCGTKYSPKQQQQILFETIPEVKCAVCGSVRYFYSIPIAILLQPVVTVAGETGLLVIRPEEAKNPGQTQNLPSCFFHSSEDTRQVLIRETGIDINPDTLRNFGVCTDPFDKYLLVFFVNETVLYEKDLMLDEEPVWRCIITGYEDEKFLFPTEKKVVKEFFDELWYNEPDR